MQSALMASEIHKKRTGNSFIISEEVVLKEEMYEEEDSSPANQNRALAAHPQTSSNGMNKALDRVATRKLARYQEVNRRFSETFPNVAQVSLNLFQSMYPQLLPQNQTYLASSDVSQPVLHNRSKSTSDALSDTSAIQRSSPPRPSLSPAQLPASPNDRLSMPSLRPTSGSIEAYRSQSPPILAQMQHQTASALSYSMSEPVDPVLASTNGDPHPVTSQLSQEPNTLADVDMDFLLASAFLDMSGELVGPSTEGIDLARTITFTECTPEMVN